MTKPVPGPEMTRFLKDYSPYIVVVIAVIFGMAGRLTYGSIDSLQAQTECNTKEITVIKINDAERRADIAYIKENVARILNQMENQNKKIDKLIDRRYQP